MAAAAAQVIGGIECTEDEPDDDFRPPTKGTSAVAKEEAESDKRSKEAEDVAGELEADVDAADEEEPAGPPRITEHWHQLQGVPRPDEFTGPRYLAWSSHGHVAVHPEQSRLEVQYAGTEPERVQRIKDTIGLKMAALSPAATAGAGVEPGAQLLIWPAERWEKAVFSASLGSSDEQVEAVACGDGFVAALTSSRLLRVFGLSGLPLGVVAVAGRSMALAARGERLLVVTGAPGRRVPSEGEDDALEYRLLDIGARSQCAAGRLPLSPGARLRWLGLSSELVPLAIDSRGVVRALIAAGPGSWGPAGGGGGEWTVVLQLAPEEARVGPLWTVDVRHNVLLVAELGPEALEPLPAELPEGLPGGLPPADAAAAAAEGLVAPGLERAFGHGAPLREIAWQLPLGPLSNCGNVVESALRESLMARHLEEVVSSKALSAVEGAKALAAASNARLKAALTLYVQFVKGDEQERALDVAAHLLAVAGGSKQLNNAQTIAERAGMFKLADKVAALPRVPAAAALQSAAPPSTPAGPQRAPAAAVPKVVQRETQPLFEPGEGEEVAGTQRSQPQASLSATPQRDLTPAPAPAAHAPAELPAPAPPAAAAAAAAPASTNPFARRQRPQSAARAPHLLRDALGGGTLKGGDPEEPPLKAQRIAVKA